MAEIRGLQTALAPSLSLPLRFFITAIAALLIAMGLMVMFPGPFTLPYFRLLVPLSLAHIMALGFITMTIMGAIYQIVPVALQVPIFSEGLGKIHYWLYTPGVVIFATGLALYKIPLIHTGATIILVASYIFLINLGLTLKWQNLKSLTGSHVALALFYLFVTLTYGFILALNLKGGFLGAATMGSLKAHAHLAMLGWVTLIIVGVLYQLLPMFYLTRPLKGGLAWLIFILLNLGVLGLFVSLPFAPRGVAPFAIITSIGAYLFIYQTVGMMRGRARPGVDLTLGHIIASLIYFALVVTLGLAFGLGLNPRPSLYFAYGYVAILGWPSMMIMGHLYKILPFLIWYNRYREKVGREPVPLLKDMIHEGLGWSGFYIINLGVVGAAAGMALSSVPIITAFFALAFLGTLIFSINMFMVPFR